jgi:hypothetical protein
MPVRKPKRGMIKRPRNSREDAARMLSPIMPKDVPTARLLGAPSQEEQALLSLAVNAERVENVAQLVLGMSEIALRRVLTGMLQDEIPAGTKDLTTIAAILVDKFAVLQNTAGRMGGAGSATVADAMEKASKIAAVMAEMERRNVTVDVTPKG